MLSFVLQGQTHVSGSATTSAAEVCLPAPVPSLSWKSDDESARPSCETRRRECLPL